MNGDTSVGSDLDGCSILCPARGQSYCSRVCPRHAGEQSSPGNAIGLLKVWRAF